MLLKTVEDFLNKLLEIEKRNIEKFGCIKHPVTIGDMYEGLSKKLLERSIFNGLDLRVVDGYVKDDKNNLSKQIDTMVVIGDGEQIPNTQHFIYPFEKVIAMLESKKNLYSDNIGDAYENIMSFNDMFYPSDTKITELDIAKAYQYLTKTVLRKPISDNSEINQMLYHVLVVMFAMPLRIVFGYNGFSSHRHFRESYYNYLLGKIGNKGYGINSFPDLIICGNYSIIKLNFQPLYTEIQNNEFNFLVSSNDNPLHFLISMLWYKLQIRFNLPDDIWDDNDELEGGFVFLNAKLNIHKNGWEYRCIDISDEELNKTHSKIFYEPTIVDEDVFIVGNALCRKEKLNLIEFGFNENELESIKSRLIATKYFEIIDNEVQLITFNLNCVIHPKLKYIIGDDSSGDFSRWIYKNIK